MSDAKAKSEARRSKLLVGGKSRLSSFNQVVPQQVEEKNNSRPLAARRGLIDSKKTTTPNSIPNDPTQDPDVETITEFETKNRPKLSKIIDSNTQKIENSEQTENEKISHSDDTQSKPPSIKEINQIVAEQTAKFDKMSLTPKQKPTKEIKKTAKIPKQPIQASNIMRFIRLLMLIGFGIWSGLKAAKNPETKYIANFYSNEASTSPLLIRPETLNLGALKEGFLAGKEEDPHRNLLEAHFEKSSTSDKPGVVGWLGRFLEGQTESSASLVRMVWILSLLFFHYPVHYLFPPTSQPSLITQALNFYSAGLEGVLDMLLAYFGELSLHLVSLLLSASLGAMLSSSFPASAGTPSSLNSEL